MKSAMQDRRAFLRAAASVLPLSAMKMPAIALGAEVPPDPALRFAAALARVVLPVTPSHLTLLLYEEIDGPSSPTFRAVIRLTWPPGERTRSIEVTAPDSIRGQQALLAEVEDLFCKRLR